MRWLVTMGCGFVLLSGVVLRADGPASRPATKSATRSVSTQPTQPATRAATSRPAAAGKRTAESKAADDALKAAVLALTKEAQDALKKEGGALPRETSDYFKGKKAGIDQDALLAALNRSMSRDPRVDAYIKFQLLSAIDTFDADHAKPAINAFIGAPALVPMPGMGPRETQKWDSKSMNAKEEDVAKINSEFKAERAKGEAINAPMIAYRNALKEKITFDDAFKPKLLQARVEELSQRAAAGFDTFTMWKDLATAIQTWSATASKKEIISMSLFLQDYAKRTGPTVYRELRWSSPTAKTQKSHWLDNPATLEPKRMDSLIKALKTNEANAL